MGELKSIEAGVKYLFQSNKKQKCKNTTYLAGIPTLVNWDCQYIHKMCSTEYKTTAKSRFLRGF